MTSICMIVQNPYDEDVRVRRKAEALVAAGYAVDVLALRGSRREKRFAVNGVSVSTVGLGKRRGSLARYLFEYAAFFLWAGLRLSLRMPTRRYAIVEVNTLPDFLIFAAAPARWMGAALVLDMHEITPEFYMSKYGMARDSRAVRLVTWLERRSFDFADRVITIHEPMQELLVNRGLEPSKSTVLMNSADEASFVSPSEDRPRTAAGFVMMYHGTLTALYALDVAIEAFAIASAELAGAELWILGDGPDRERLERLAASRGLTTTVKFLGRRPLAAVAALVAQCDAGVLSMRRDVFLDYAFPNKLSEYVLLGKPVAAPRLKTLGHYFDDGALAYFEPGSARDLAVQMIRLSRQPELRARLAAGAAAEYAPIRWGVMRDRYLRLMADLTRSETDRSRSGHEPVPGQRPAAAPPPIRA